MANIQGKTYTKIVTTGSEIWNIVPFDDNGNVVSEMVIECDTTLGDLTLNLPKISTLNNNWSTKITIVGNVGIGNNGVGIKSFPTTALFQGDTIGGADNIFLADPYITIVLNVAGYNTWYGVRTLGA